MIQTYLCYITIHIYFHTIAQQSAHNSFILICNGKLYYLS